MKSLVLFLGVVLATGIAVAADIALPTKDVPGSQDPAVIGRFADSVIIDYVKIDFDEFALPIGPLAKVEGKRDQRNNVFYEPKATKALEGRRIRVMYVMPEGVAPLQALRNYQNEVKSKGGRTLFECKDVDCGGGQRLSWGGGGHMSLSMYIWPREKGGQQNKAGECALKSRIAEQRYTALELAGARAYASVLTYAINENTGDCKTFNGRTVVALDVLEPQAMAQKMQAPKADEMAQSISAMGRVALYGLYFDSSKSDVKPESKDTLEQIALLLKNQPALKLLVVGHTDNVGGFSANAELSRRRAEAVIAALVAQYQVDAKRLQPFGVSFASPIAANSSEEGRAKNRRVELVPAS
jgi:OmpA-OmpF porin, OOP family